MSAEDKKQLSKSQSKAGAQKSLYSFLTSNPDKLDYSISQTTAM